MYIIIYVWKIFFYGEPKNTFLHVKIGKKGYLHFSSQNQVSNYA